MNGNPSIVSGTVGARCCQSRIFRSKSALPDFLVSRLKSDKFSPRKIEVMGFTYAQDVKCYLFEVRRSALTTFRSGRTKQHATMLCS